LPKRSFRHSRWKAGVLPDLLSPPDNTDALFVLLDLDGFAPRDWRRPGADGFGLLAERADMLAGALREFSSRSSVPLLINSIPAPAAPTAGLLDRRHAMGLRRGIDLLNQCLLEAAERSNRIIVIDSDQALSTLPARDHVDPKFWYYGRVAYSAEATRVLARAFAEAWHLLRRGSAKVLAVDLDNTLWGGVYGDDGIERLDCGEDFPGNAFRAMQLECLRLRGQGLLLVALSKNNSDAISVFERHPGMVLRPDDFASVAINWDPKPDNLRRIAVDLNLGLDSFIFLDDSPHERDAMRRLCPEVMVPELPQDPAERPSWLRSLRATWPVRLTAEDETRAAMYDSERRARSARESATSFEDYLQGLEQRLVLSFVRNETVARAAQMHQRTNQFNLTTLRLTETEIASLTMDDTRGLAVLGRVADKFGDHGIVIVATIAFEGSEAVIRTLLMSCRVIGREVERAFLGELLRELSRRGISRVHGRYVPTHKNTMVKDFYASCGFKTWDAGNGETVWTFVPDRQELPASKYVTVSWEG
jgi:FkbH-like protein